MPDEKPCPVVAAFIRYAKNHLDDDAIRAVYVDVNYKLDEVLEFSRTQPTDPASQRVRAFYCLHALFMILALKTGSDTNERHLDREDITKLIAFCSEMRDSEEVKLYVQDLTPGRRQFDAMVRDSSTALIGLTDTIVNAAEYLRPKLRNGSSMAGMGRYLGVGLAQMRVPSDRFVVHATRLANVSSVNKGEHS